MKGLRKCLENNINNNNKNTNKSKQQQIYIFVEWRSCVFTAFTMSSFCFLYGKGREVSEQKYQYFILLSEMWSVYQMPWLDDIVANLWMHKQLTGIKVLYLYFSRDHSTSICFLLRLSTYRYYLPYLFPLFSENLQKLKPLPPRTGLRSLCIT